MAQINLDNAENQSFKIHKNEKCSLTFVAQTELGESWDANGKIVVGSRYENSALKTYTVGDGVTITGDTLKWDFESGDWNHIDVVYDFSFIRVANNQRDLKGSITVNSSFL